ncbi:MAG: hypothetical protein AB7S59_14320, partial [Parvibaculaceae bacterium]
HAEADLVSADIRLIVSGGRLLRRGRTAEERDESKETEREDRSQTELDAQVPLSPIVTAMDLLPDQIGAFNGTPLRSIFLFASSCPAQSAREDR